MPTLTPVQALPTVRDLPCEEWDRLLGFEPFASQGLPPPETSRIIVAEVASAAGPQIVAYWGLFFALHAEPLWIHPDYRRRPGLVRRLWTGMLDTMRSLNASTAFACVFDENVPTQRLAGKAEFTKLPGSLYYFTRKD